MLLWKDSINLTVVDSSKYYVDVFVDRYTEQAWHFTSFYGEPVAWRRHEEWSKLSALNTYSTIPWLCASDFNEFTRQDEKIGGAPRNHNQMQLFRTTIDECGLMDLGFISPKFTWSKHFTNGQSIWERLDRGLASNSWFLRFPGTWIHHLPCLSSDHYPLLINPSGIDLPSQEKKKIHFEEMWLSDSRCGEVVLAAWNSCANTDLDRAVINKVNQCERDLTWWNHNVFGNVRKELNKKKKTTTGGGRHGY